ncbi:glycosyltransferase [Actinophytocola oryzae]|uniref:Trehalose synthase (ADP-glucose) n=1 Tax=Actinophytocola oryzae TaxID=502181 RepID=A0A4R7UY53_9PSEU|nr:glycosyltransferase [Actinophytocola oryzae]TDV41094.1 trehalose synthase (ADP-glucose) [Actinophytocola oryzae]
MVTPTWALPPGAGPRLVHVSSTARGGRVAELLSSLVPAQVATGLSVGWAVVEGDAAFFAVTRYLHQLLHGRADALTTDRLAVSLPSYRTVLASQANRLVERLTPGDVVVLHDPATLGMAPRLAAAGMAVVWHCHVGTTDGRATGPSAVWYAFAGELSDVDIVMTPLTEFAPPLVPPVRKRVVAPAVDPNSAKNRVLSRLEFADLLGNLGQVDEDGPLPAGAPLVLQVSRWDPLTEMPGVLRLVHQLPPEVHVVLACDGQTQDALEGWAVLEEIRSLRAALSPAERARVHLVLPDDDDTERAALVVNALQRRADVVLQKSLGEGFGLSVTEAMVKGRAVVAADVGGLREQVSPWHNGLLVDPRDNEAVVYALRTMLGDELLRARLGRRAEESARRRYLLPRMVADYERFVAASLLVRAPEVA